MTNIARKWTSLVGILFASLAMGCVSIAGQEGTGEYADDTVINEKIRTAMLAEPSLKSAVINVQTVKGVVQLTGSVSSPANEAIAVQVACGVDGVKAVSNDMRLK